LVAWFDGVKTGYARIDDWTNMRAAVKDNDWGRVHHYMELYKDRPLTHAYALFAFAKMEMQIEHDGGMSMHCADAFAHAKVHSNSSLLTDRHDDDLPRPRTATDTDTDSPPPRHMHCLLRTHTDAD
jgi:hypothetical protein